MIAFNCDYNEGAHPRILEALIETNMEQTAGYGEDQYCKEAETIIKGLCQSQKAEVHFMVGGTQANLTVISSILRPHQAVVCAVSGHINVHETGAIEACGHKVMTLPSDDGKISAKQVEEVYMHHKNDASFEHMTQPKLVYISNPTELGTIYTKKELEDLRTVCDECGMYLYLDGARLGYGLCADGNDLDLEIIAKNCDVFYIGGTKVGALFGEAIVICNVDLQEDFRYIMKQKGGMLAKGRLLGLQFKELFKDGLYFAMSKHAIHLAMRLKNGLTEKGYKFFIDSNTNQQFVIVPDEKLEELKETYAYTYQEKYDEKSSVIRLCTSWATKEENIEQLLRDM
ncbi:threonine aldolase family protein [Faecalimonas sp.]